MDLRWLLLLPALAAQQAGVNYDEAKVPPYTLPDPLETTDGRRVTSPRQWFEQRRPELLRIFETRVYGKAPPRPGGVSSEITDVDVHAFAETALRKQISVYLTGEKTGPKLSILMYLPRRAPRPVPVFLGLNFGGNQTVANDPGITSFGEAPRGSAASRWQVEKILATGYGLVTLCYNEIEADKDDGFQHGVHTLFYARGQKRPANDEWGSIAAWAWGLRRAIDCLETDSDIDMRRIAVFGHSRLGKTALWAGAQDQRIAIVIAAQSGEGGAALARRWFGETHASIVKAFPHWFCANFNRDPVEAIPVDQHELIALIAPRPVYISSASEDLWADPKGEFLAAKAASPVYRLLGTDGLDATGMPTVHEPVMTTIGYHIRAGEHNVTAYDWDRYIEFVSRHWKRGKRR